MASPFVRVDAEGRIVSDFGKITDPYGYLAEHGGETTSAAPSVIETHPNGGTVPGTLDNEDGGDLIAVNLTAGQTYTFSYRGTETNGVVDPWLKLLAADQTTLIAQDDDGGLGRTSQITYTATTTGTHYLNATSWYQVDPTAPDFQDNGDYTITTWSPEAGHDAGSTLATAADIGVGTSYAYLEAPFDQDFYEIELTEGMVYTFTYNGGVSSGSDWDDEPGESIGVLGLYDANGANVVPLSVNFETGITFVAQESGTYYLRALPYSSFAGVPGPEMTGGYTLDIAESALADHDPLDAINWFNADNVDFVDVNGTPTAYVYFAEAGENFGELTGPGETIPADAPLRSFGWSDYEQQQLMLALEEFEHILGVNYEVTTDVDQATFRVITTTSERYGAYFYPQDPGYGTQQGIGAFNVDSGGWGAFPQSLERGGFSFAVILHEFGHAHGLSHPHDTGGGSDVMLGVAGSDSLGLYDLNQGVYTVMSYNDAFPAGPNGPSPFTVAGIDNGWSATLSAFDIAVLQQRYGVHDYATGDDVYTLANVEDEAFYQTIWDSGGTDAVVYDGDRAAHIDLLAATLDYSPTGGGVVSLVSEIHGGYTIANGVVIENASGGNGDDGILGNAAANILEGNGGDDILVGRGGGDTLDGGAGFDTASYVDSDSGVVASLASRRGSTGDAAGDRYYDVEALTGSNFDDRLSGGNGEDTLSGLDGDDILDGGNRDDILNGGAGNDTLDGGNSSDLLDGGDGDDILDGGNSSDHLLGGAGNDTLDGGNSADILNGGAGDDTLDGGNSRDSYVFADAGEDTIVDYERGETIDLSSFVGVGEDDVTISADSIFVDLEGSDDLTINIEGDSVQMRDIIFAPADAAGASSAADMHGQIMIA